MGYLIAAQLRREELCTGGPKACSEANTVSCQRCGNLWVPEDIQWPGECPECGLKDYRRERCSGCLIPKMDIAMQSEQGDLIARTIAIENRLTLGLPFEPNMEEFRALMLLRRLKERYIEEQRLRSGHG